MIFRTYNTLLTLSLPVVVPYLLLKGQRGSSPAIGLSERLGFLGTKGMAKKHRPVWFHAASVGEVQMTVPLIHAFWGRFPGHCLLLSTMTQTGQAVARKLLGEGGTIIFSPLDLPWTVRRSLAAISPRALLIAETEIWPNLLYQCRRRGIPVVLFNGRISDRSFQSYLRFRFFFREIVQGVSAFGMQSDRDAERIIEIGAPRDRVVITGNLKFDRPAFDSTEEEIQRVRHSLGLRRERTVFVAGSTHDGEEEMILQAFRHLRRIEPSLALILAPRHLERLGEVGEALDRSGFSWARRSQVSRDGPSCEIVLLDTMGELERIYSIGTVIFVGGSLVPVGGHNILEPAAFGKPVIFGPHMQNFREVAGIMKAEGGGIEVRNPEELRDQAQRLLTDRSYHSRVSGAALQAIQKNQGATRRTLRIIERCLE